MLKAILSPEEAAGRSAARSKGGEALLPYCPLPGVGGPGRKELRAAAARGSVWTWRTLIGCKKVKLKPR